MVFASFLFVALAIFLHLLFVCWYQTMFIVLKCKKTFRRLGLQSMHSTLRECNTNGLKERVIQTMKIPDRAVYIFQSFALFRCDIKFNPYTNGLAKCRAQSIINRIYVVLIDIIRWCGERWTNVFYLHYYSALYWLCAFNWYFFL